MWGRSRPTEAFAVAWPTDPVLGEFVMREYGQCDINPGGFHAVVAATF